jgi:toxin FitB
VILLDTNVISELMRPSPSPDVEAWLASEPSEGLFTSAVTEAELRYGLGLLPEGRRRGQLADAIDGLLSEDFGGRILPFDRMAALAYAEIAVDRRRAGRPISPFDGQIAAIARSHDATLATRNVQDFESCGVRLLNPWRKVMS